MNAYQERQSSGIHWLDQPAGQPAAWLHQTCPAVPTSPEPITHTAVWGSLEKQMAESAAQPDALVNEVRKHYVLPADTSVTSFLAEHRTVPQLLIEAAPRLRSYFGGNAVFKLCAPVDEAGSRTLYAVAMWPGKLRDVRAALARFDSHWWMARAGQAAGSLTFTYELV